MVFLLLFQRRDEYIPHEGIVFVNYFTRKDWFNPYSQTVKRDESFRVGVPTAAD